jgi:TetR/AcrR family transcriptional regulator of autoinduction and epiphytic fitness
MQNLKSKPMSVEYTQCKLYDLDVKIQEKRTLSDRKREDIIKAAIKEFDTHGFQKTSMDQIAKTANVSKRTVYNHFPSKDTLFTEITAMMWQQCLAATDYTYRKDKPLSEQLTTIAVQQMALLKSQNFISVSRLIFSECFHSQDAIDQIMAQVDESENSLILWLKDAIEDKKLAINDIEVASSQFYGMLKSLAFWPQVIGFGLYPQEDQVQEIIQSSVAMFLKYYEIQ